MSIVYDRKDVDTTDRGDGQQKTYLALSDEERAKGFVRPVRRSYKHVGAPGPKYPLRELTDEERERFKTYGYSKFEAYPDDSPERVGSVTGMFWTQDRLNKAGKGCGTVTTMADPLAETYARKPEFYSGTFCCGCGAHFPVGQFGEFVWEPDGERVGT